MSHKFAAGEIWTGHLEEAASKVVTVQLDERGALIIVNRDLKKVVGVPAYLARKGYSAGTRVLATRMG